MTGSASRHLSTRRRVRVGMSAERRREQRSIPSVCEPAPRGGRLASAGVLALVAFLAWAAAGPVALSSRVTDGLVAATTAATPTRASAGQRDDVLAVRHDAAPSGRAVLGAQRAGRERGTDAHSGSTAPPSLAASRAELLGHVAHGTRALLERHALRHAPHGEPSPYFATAPPSRSARNG